MAKVLKRRWPSASVGSGLSRRDSRPCDYEAYAPDPLVDAASRWTVRSPPMSPTPKLQSYG